MAIRHQTKLVLSVLFSLFMLGCNETFTGEFNVYSTVALIGPEDAVVSLAPGTYPTKLRFDESRSVFEFELTDPSKGRENLYLKGAQSIHIPETSGSFSVAASGNGLTYDISGVVSSDTSKTETVRDFEFCTVQRTITDCSGPPEANCSQVWRTFRGNQPVNYYFDQKIKQLTIQLIGSEGRQILAAFKAETGQRRKIYTYRGPCLAEPR